MATEHLSGTAPVPVELVGEVRGNVVARIVLSDHDRWVVGSAVSVSEGAQQQIGTFTGHESLVGTRTEIVVESPATINHPTMNEEGALNEGRHKVATCDGCGFGRPAQHRGPTVVRELNSSEDVEARLSREPVDDPWHRVGVVPTVIVREGQHVAGRDGDTGVAAAGESTRRGRGHRAKPQRARIHDVGADLVVRLIDEDELHHARVGRRFQGVEQSHEVSRATDGAAHQRDGGFAYRLARVGIRLTHRPALRSHRGAARARGHPIRRSDQRVRRGQYCE